MSFTLTNSLFVRRTEFYEFPIATANTYVNSHFHRSTGKRYRIKIHCFPRVAASIEKFNKNVTIYKSFSSLRVGTGFTRVRDA